VGACACKCVCVRGKTVIVHMLPVIFFLCEIYREEIEKCFYLR